MQRLWRAIRFWLLPAARSPEPDQPPPLRITPLPAPPRRLSDEQMTRHVAEQRAIVLRIQAAARVMGRELSS